MNFEFDLNLFGVFLLCSLAASLVVVCLLYMMRYPKVTTCFSKLSSAGLTLFVLCALSLILLFIDFMNTSFSLMLLAPSLFLLPLFFNQIYALFLPEKTRKGLSVFFISIAGIMLLLFLAFELDWLSVSKLYYHNLFLIVQAFCLSLGLIMTSFYLKQIQGLSKEITYSIYYVYVLHGLAFLISVLHLMSLFFFFNEEILGVYFNLYFIMCLSAFQLCKLVFIRSK